jgi:hypothetical protein
MAKGIAAIGRFGCHYSRETKTFRDFAVEEKRRVDPQLVSGQDGKPLNIERRSGVRILPNSEDMICPENENVAPMRLNEVITEFIDKDLIARVHCAFGNDVAATISVAGENVEIVTESLRRRVDEKILLADQS